MKLNLKLLSLIILLFVLTGCTVKDSGNTIDNSPIYTGRKLTIGVIGKPPIVREKNVKFNLITFRDLEQLNLSTKFDAIFIMKENLRKAAESKYARIYKSAGIPFFFIQSKKSYIPFIDEETSYDSFPDSQSKDYATGYLELNKEGRYWGYGLYNNKINGPNIKDVYSRIFKTIDETSGTLPSSE
ncbi:hypothetical protein IEC97_26605 [Neobacillus cucumis]|uniref:hypothetical protein n=1 Tax=Neobacillus cucumis TaxID=1740721 RepID=UPI0018DFFFB5|nr:hypothetical protein [Neobacillus cucumis]MBI0580903.1 hypothetical protein [Neobacillus cucumis]